MNTYHVLNRPLFDTYKSPENAIFMAEKTHKTMLTKLSFHIEDFFDLELKDIIYDEKNLLLCFSNSSFLNVTIGQHYDLELSRPDVINMDNIQKKPVELIFSNTSKYIWYPEESLTLFKDKRFQNIHISTNRIYFYFYKCHALLSVSPLFVEEYPYGILYWHESD